MFWLLFLFGKDYPKIVDLADYCACEWEIGVDYCNFDECVDGSMSFKGIKLHGGNYMNGTLFKNLNSGRSTQIMKISLENYEALNKTIVLRINNGKSEDLSQMSVKTMENSTRVASGFVQGYDVIITFSVEQQIRIRVIKGKKELHLAALRKVDPDNENPLKFYHVLSIIGMFGVIMYMIMSPDEPRVKPQKKND